MVNNTALTKARERDMIGAIYSRYLDGSSNVEIATCLNIPVAEVDECIFVCKVVEHLLHMNSEHTANYEGEA